ncbi:VOC family protein [Fangia hongkongensis]|uniref:VOC family protein n=1 Tax=Fangia hongkongensis TaxID=270495 RepID=UPI000380F7FA|nr:VOC family protein [Fangia hongkongensis]MBK2126336.1 VOC family protein [Fangia hongkongensis]
MATLSPFHLAMPVNDIEKAKHFYKNVLGLTEGRSDTSWVDFDFFGHQVVFHLDNTKTHQAIKNPVDGHGVPVPHFGVVLEWSQWEHLAENLQKHEVEFIIEPYIRFEGQPGEQGTFFFADPNGLHLEFKTFKDRSKLFATD